MLTYALLSVKFLKKEFIIGNFWTKTLIAQYGFILALVIILYFVYSSGNLFHLVVIIACISVSIVFKILVYLGWGNQFPLQLLIYLEISLVITIILIALCSIIGYWWLDCQCIYMLFALTKVFVILCPFKRYRTGLLRDYDYPWHVWSSNISSSLFSINACLSVACLFWMKIRTLNKEHSLNLRKG